MNGNKYIDCAPNVRNGCFCGLTQTSIVFVNFKNNIESISGCIPSVLSHPPLALLDILYLPDLVPAVQTALPVAQTGFYPPIKQLLLFWPAVPADLPATPCLLTGILSLYFLEFPQTYLLHLVFLPLLRPQEFPCSSLQGHSDPIPAGLCIWMYDCCECPF